MREIFLAGEKAQECPALLRAMIPDRATQHRVARFERIQYRVQRDRMSHFQFDFAANMRQSSKMLRQFNSNHS